MRDSIVPGTNLFLLDLIKSGDYYIYDTKKDKCIKDVLLFTNETYEKNRIFKTDDLKFIDLYLKYDNKVFWELHYDDDRDGVHIVCNHF